MNILAENNTNPPQLDRRLRTTTYRHPLTPLTKLWERATDDHSYIGKHRVSS